MAANLAKVVSQIEDVAYADKIAGGEAETVRKVAGPGWPIWNLWAWPTALNLRFCKELIRASALQLCWQQLAEGGGWPNVGWREAYCFSIMALAVKRVHDHETGAETDSAKVLSP